MGRLIKQQEFDRRPEALAHRLSLAEACALLSFSRAARGAYACMMKSFYHPLFICVWLLLTCTSCANTVEVSQHVPQPDATSRKANSPLVYVALGDSTGLGLGAQHGGYVERLMKRIKQRRTDAKLVNLCTAGATTAQVLQTQMNRFSESQAAFVTVGIGINDLVQGVPEQEFADNYNEIVTRLNKAGIPVVLMNLPDLTAAPAMAGLQHDEIKLRTQNFNKLIEEVARRHQTLLVDLHNLKGDSIKSRTGYFSADGFHPSDSGYEAWTEFMWPVVEKLIDENRVQ
jgi:acyl-CoA thioesterase-1